jgi:hypothetical protein
MHENAQKKKKKKKKKIEKKRAPIAFYHDMHGNHEVGD